MLMETNNSNKILNDFSPCFTNPVWITVTFYYILFIRIKMSI